jgi:hypothetical protein
MTELNLSATSRQLFASPESGIARVFWISIALAGASAAYAATSARDLVYDGSFYLLGIASHDRFQLFEPGRISVQLFQQCFAVAGMRLGIHDLWALGRLFALGASGWPIVLTALCWFVLPRGEKSWIAGPLLNLVFAIPTTSFIGVGEGVIASCFLWLAYLLVMFRVDRKWGAFAAILAITASAFSHESAVLSLALIATLAVLHLRGTKGFARAATVVVAIIATAGTCYMLFWILFPRSAIERSDFLVSLLGGFLGTLRAPNLPALASFAGAAAIPFALSRNDRVRTAAIVSCFVVLASLLFRAAWIPREPLAPSSFFAAQGLPVAFTTLLTLVFFLTKRGGICPEKFANAAVLSILLGLSVFQPLVQAIMTETWNAYAHDLRGLVSTRKGAISHAEAMQALDPDGGRFRRELLESWSIEPLSIVLASNGRVTAVVEPAPNARWVPYRLDSAASRPQAPGLDWSGFSTSTVRH